MIAGNAVTLADGWAGCRAVEIAAAVYESTVTGEPVRLVSPDAVSDGPASTPHASRQLQ